MGPRERRKRAKKTSPRELEVLGWQSEAIQSVRRGASRWICAVVNSPTFHTLRRLRMSSRDRTREVTHDRPKNTGPAMPNRDDEAEWPVRWDGGARPGTVLLRKPAIFHAFPQRLRPATVIPAGFLRPASKLRGTNPPRQDEPSQGAWKRLALGDWLMPYHKDVPRSISPFARSPAPPFQPIRNRRHAGGICTVENVQPIQNPLRWLKPSTFRHSQQ